MVALARGAAASANDKMATSHVAPTLLDNASVDLEYSVHSVPKAHRDDVAAIFPGVDLDRVLVVPTCQRAREDLVTVGEKVEQEKDRLLNTVSPCGCAVLDVLGRTDDARCEHRTVHGLVAGTLQASGAEGVLGRLHRSVLRFVGEI